MALDATVTPGVNLYTPAFAAGMVNVTALSPQPQLGWTYANGVFAAPAAPAPTQAQLAAYANAKQWALATGGYTITLTPVGAPAAEAFVFATDATSYSLMTGKALRLQQANPPAATNWQFASGFASIATADFIAAAIEVADFMQATWNTLETVLATIAAGTITTMAEVDTAAWPWSVSTTPA